MNRGIAPAMRIALAAMLSLFAANAWPAAPADDDLIPMLMGVKANQTITFGALSNRPVTTPPFTVSATAWSGLPVSFASTTGTKCTVSGSTVTLVSAGTCTIRASQAGNGVYNAAPNVDRSFLVMAVPTLQTTPAPTSGTMLATPLGDTANLQGGVSPTGSITFRLYPPSDPNCTGTESFINSVNVTGNGVYSTSLNYQKGLVNQTGTWHWKAVYSGDANNSTVTSPCASEPVVITKPVLSIAKTPDNGTIPVGSTATFTIVVTNLGPGTAKDATISDALPSGGGLNWQTSSSGCSISGAVGSQVLNCSLGTNFAANAATPFTAVVTATTSSGQCAVMNNTATAVAANADQVSDWGKITCQSLASQTITFPVIGNRAYGAASFAISATATSGLAVGFTSLSTSVCTLSGNTVSLIAAGTCTIRASQTGNAEFLAALNVDRSFVVIPPGTLTYTYDAAGNITGIQRSAP